MASAVLPSRPEDVRAPYSEVHSNLTRCDKEVWNDKGLIWGGSGEFLVLLAAGLLVG